MRDFGSQTQSLIPRFETKQATTTTTTTTTTNDDDCESHETVEKERDKQSSWLNKLPKFDSKSSIGCALFILFLYYKALLEWALGVVVSIVMLSCLVAAMFAVVQIRRSDDSSGAETNYSRIKSVEFHSTEPWILLAQYSGDVAIWNVDKEKQPGIQISVSELPVRVAKFIERKAWIVTASDDMHIRVFTYHGKNLHDFEAHDDYIRSIELHPTLPYIFTSSDDMLIKVWDMEYNFNCVNTLEGHNHYVMQVKVNPKNTTTFASASLDRTVKVWDIQAARRGQEEEALQFTLDEHEKGVNAIDYHRGDKPFLISGSDDGTARVWNYETQALVCCIPAHKHNVTAVLFHPISPFIVSASEDGTCFLWNSQTYRMAQKLPRHSRGRAWSVAVSQQHNKLAIAYDRGCVCVNLHESKKGDVVDMEFLGTVQWSTGESKNESDQDT
jgi:coatomer subunit beta'